MKMGVWEESGGKGILDGVIFFYDSNRDRTVWGGTNKGLLEQPIHGVGDTVSGMDHIKQWDKVRI